MQYQSYKKVSLTVINQIINNLQEYEIRQNDKNKSHVFKIKNNIVTIYKNNTVLFQGVDPDQLIAQFFNNGSSSEDLPHHKAQKQPMSNYIGCDEVGVGDFFGPLVTTAVYWPSTLNANQLKHITIKDSKLMSSSEIHYAANELRKILKCKTIVVDNPTYNDLYTKYKNAHVIKTWAHLKGIHSLLNNLPAKDVPVVLDAYCSKKNFTKYAQQTLDDPLNINIYLYQKAETSHLGVAAAAIISRDTFISEINLLSKKMGIPIPLGTSRNVQKKVAYLKANWPPEKIKQILKLHFKTKL